MKNVHNDRPCFHHALRIFTTDKIPPKQTGKIFFGQADIKVPNFNCFNFGKS